MIRVCNRYPDEIVKQVKQQARDRGIAESEMWRIVVARGINNETVFSTQILLESLCLNRRIAATMDTELIKKAREDAQFLLARIANYDHSEEGL